MPVHVADGASRLAGLELTVTPAARVIGYARVSTKGQADNGVSLESQRAAIHAAAAARGWHVVLIIEEQVSGGAKQRPERDRAVRLIENGAAEALVAAKLDRVTRSTVDFGQLVERARAKRWALVVLDIDLDTTTPMGEAMANMVVTFAQLERRLIGQRTKDALDTKRRQGVQLGRPSQVSPAVAARIRRERDDGRSLAAIAEGLNRDAVPTAHGGAKWYPSTVRSVLGAERKEQQ